MVPKVVMKNQSKKRDIDRVKTMIWSPTTDDYLDLEPELVYPDTFELNADWNNLYLFVSTKKTTLGIGREIRYLIRDAKTRTYLGVIDYLVPTSSILLVEMSTSGGHARISRTTLD